MVRTRLVDALASEMMRPAFWLAAVQIMGINILLSGDNAVVIALAVRGLPPKERFWGMVIGYVVSRLVHFAAYLTARTHDTRATLWTIGSMILVFITCWSLIAALRA